ncbi:hypothetical protein BH23ACT11_BH23ACT11_02590 [soil metagenome]|jgi:hypothetical protein
MSYLRNPVHIGKVVRDAVLFDFKNSHEELLNAEQLPEAVDRLFALLDERRIDYLLVGGVALLQYVEGRNTEDVKLIMTSSGLEKLSEIDVSDRDPDFANGSFEALKIDLLLTNNPLFERVRRRYATIGRFVEREIPCATVEGLIILKLYALPSLYRQGDFAKVGLYENDVATLLQAYRPPVESLVEELSGHLTPTDLSSVRDILSEILQRIERFRKGSDSQD